MTINILCATDNNFAPFCGIMLTSLFRNNRNNQICVYIIVDETFSQKEKQRFLSLGTKEGQEINFILTDNKKMEQLPPISDSIAFRITQTSYYRLLVGSLLPPHIHKILYLDCDIIVNDDLAPLWQTNIEGKALGCVKDCWIHFHSEMIEMLGYNPKDGYFNTGVLLINIDYWKQHNVETRLLAYAQANYDKLQYNDQDILNGELHSEVVWLPERYNFQVNYLRKDHWATYPPAFQQTILQEKQHVAIIHYIGACKPWDFQYPGMPFDKLWHTYRKKSPWRKIHIAKPRIRYIKKLVKSLLFPSKYREGFQTFLAYYKPDWDQLYIK